MSDVTSKKLNIYIDQSSAQYELDKLNKTAAVLKKTIDEGTAAGKKMKDAISRLKETEADIKDVQSQLDKGLAPSIRQQTTYVIKLQNELKKMSSSAPEFDKLSAKYKEQNALLKKMQEETYGVKKAQQAITNESSLFGKIGLAGGVALGNLYSKAAELAIDAGKHFVTVNAEFEKSVANLSAITGAVGKDLEFLKDSAINLSATTTHSAKDYVEAMKFIASAKPELLTQKEALVEVTKAAVLLADASGLELPDASKRLTDALNQFGAPASQAAKYVDALAAAAKYGAAEVPEVTDALLQFGSQAKSANISIYESSAAIEVLAEKGIKGAEAGTKLRNVFLALNAVKSLDRKALQSLEDAGVNTTILSDKTLSLEARLKELSKVQGDASALVNIFGKENFNAGQIILQNLGRYSELVKQTKEVGVANQQATVNTDTLQDAWKRLGNIADAEFLSNGGAFTSFLKSIVNFGSKALTTLGSVVTIGKALATFDFGIFGRINKEVAKNKEAAVTNTRVNTIIDVYTQQEQGKANATERILKRLRDNVDKDYKAFYDARAKGDKEAAAKAYADLQLAGKALAKFRADQKTIGTTKEDTKLPGDTGGGKGGSGIDKKELNTRLATLREEVKKSLTTSANLEAVTYSQPIKPNLTIDNPDKLLDEGMNLVDKILNEQAKRNKRAGLILDVMKFGNTSKKGVDAQKKINAEDEEAEIQEAKRQAALNGTELTENEIAVIRAKWRKINQDLDQNATQKLISDISNYAQQAIAIFDQLSQAQTNRENAVFANEQKNNTKRKKDIQALEKDKVITSVEARRRIAEIERDEEKKREELDKKQRERQKRTAIAQAIVNGALAITSILAGPTIDPTGLLKAIQIGAAIATTAAQIAVISSQKYAKGGKLSGPSHSAGGMPVINPVTGAKEAEVEGGEYILSKATVANNRTLADMLLHSSMNQNGAPIALPQWQSRSYQPIDFAGITQSATKLRFASGGVMPGASASNTQSQNVDPVLLETLMQTQQFLAATMETNMKLTQQLNQGIKSSVSLKELDDATTLKANILSEANP